MAKAASKTVLVVEDDLLLQNSLRDVLEFEGYQVVTANNGLEALKVLAGNGRPGLILLDLMMPVMDGWEFLDKRGREGTLGEVPIVVFTAAGEKKLKDIEAAAVIRKPIDLDVLLDHVKRLCLS